MTSPTTFTVVRVLQAVSVPTAGLLSGLIACMSYAGMPAVAIAPADTASKQWRRIYDLGVAIMPPAVSSTAACYGYLAYSTSRLPGLFPTARFDPTAPSVLYLTAALLLPTIVPWTIGVMLPTNNLLTMRAEDRQDKKSSGVSSSADDNASVRANLEKWAKLNYVRAYIVGAGALLASTATVLSS